MKEFISLRILDRFRSIFLKMGINYDIMRRILQLKLIMDGRRVPTALSSKSENKDENLLKKSLISYGILGLFIMLIIIIPFPMYFKMSICFGMLMFMIMMIMIADFSSVLLDVKGRNVFLTKPVDRRTFNAAKLVHIFIYMFTITAVMAVLPLIAGTIKYGIAFFILFIIELILLAGFVMFLASLLYSVVLRLFDGEKLKDVINYVQIILSIIMVIGYQLIGRMFEIIDINIAPEPKWWSAFIPSAWFAAPFELFINNNNTNFNILLSLLCILVPTITFIIYIKAVAPRFENDLSKLNSNSGKNKGNIEKRGYFKKKFVKIFSTDPLENIFLRFSQNMLSTERSLKLKIYPNLALSVVIPFLMMLSFLRGVSSLEDFLNMISESKSFFSIYLSVLLLTNIVFIISTSENFKGSWIYKTLPIKSYEPIYKGAIKGFLIKYCIPIYLLSSCLFLVIYKFKIILDLFLILISMILSILIVVTTCRMRLPFSEDVKKAQNGDIRMFLISISVLGLFAGIHYMARKTMIWLILFTLTSTIFTVILWKKSFKSINIDI